MNLKIVVRHGNATSTINYPVAFHSATSVFLKASAWRLLGIGRDGYLGTIRPRYVVQCLFPFALTDLAPNWYDWHTRLV
jgi:hypothetical protein